MKNYKLYSFILIIMLIVLMLVGCSASPDNSDDASSDINDQIENNYGELVEFRAVDCGLMAQDVYDFPFLGMNIKLTDAILEKMDSKEIFVFTQEDYTADYNISYGVMRFSVTTEEDRNAEPALSVDIYGFESSLEKIGAIGAYEKNVVSQLDELTACDTHEKIGTSTDGAYEYYISTNSNGNKDFAAELKKAEITIGEIHEFDPNLGYSAFSTDRIDNINTVGIFSMEDVYGNTYTQDIFAENDLTLVNLFTTWCSPCVEEIPELEILRREYANKGIKLGIAAVVLDVKTENGIDQGALEKAQVLHVRSKAKFPFLIPDDSNMNGRLTGIEAFPESFFVDKNGNIVSDPYVGANTRDEWAKIVDQEFAKLQGDN